MQVSELTEEARALRESSAAATELAGSEEALRRRAEAELRDVKARLDNAEDAAPHELVKQLQLELSQVNATADSLRSDLQRLQVRVCLFASVDPSIVGSFPE